MNTMRAVVHDRYGPPDVLRLEEVERPSRRTTRSWSRSMPRRSTGRTATFARPTRSLALLHGGLLRPKRRILGSELAGEVEAVGAAVTEFAVGDRVFGITGGSARHAEFVCVPESGPLAHMPTGMSFEEAAAVCDGATRGTGVPETGGCPRGAADPRLRRVWIHRHGSACSWPGTSAPHVTAVCNTKNVELVRSLGADEVVDYSQEDFTKNGETYDVIFDAVGKHSFRRCRRSLKPGGIFVATDLGFLWHVPLLALADPVDRRQEGDVRRSRGYNEEGRPLPQGAHRGGEVPGGHRSPLPAGAGGRGDAVRRDAAEDRERRPDGQP